MAENEEDSPIRTDENGNKYVVCMCNPERRFDQPFICLECGVKCNRAYFKLYVWGDDDDED